MIDPKTVLLAIPSHTGFVSCELNGMLVNYGHRYFGGLTQPTECSHPSLVRNIIADTFLRSPFEWLVGIDSDMIVGLADFELLMQEVNPDEVYHEDLEQEDSGHGHEAMPPRPTRIKAPAIFTDLGDIARTKGVQAPPALADVLVNCEYAYKREPFEPVQFGLGCYRAHRSVFERLQQLTHADDGRRSVPALQLKRVQELVNAEDVDVDTLRVAVQMLMDTQDTQTGSPRLWQTMHNGRLLYDYYPSGPLIDQQVPVGRWMGEDHGFWTLCHLAQLVPRIETRTRLVHLGRKGYVYEGPERGAMQ